VLSFAVADAAPLSTWQSLRAVAGSRRLLCVALLSFSSALPLGLVWIAIPTWMTQVGTDIKIVGLFALAQLPWTIKFLWSPLMDRYSLPFLGRKRGWIFLSQLVLVGLSLALARSSAGPEGLARVALLSLLTALASATQDIAIDGYTVEVLRSEEHGLAVGARAVAGRAGLFLSGGFLITYAAWTSWPAAHRLLGLTYLPFLLVTWLSPEPEVALDPPRTLREAVWEPFTSFLGQHRAIEILAFVVLYKLSDQLAQALISPFLVQTGFSAQDVGINKNAIGMFSLLGGTFVGGLLTSRMGLGRALWVFGIIQSVAHLGYAAVAEVGVNRPLMWCAQALEMGTGGMATGAFSVFLLRLTQKRFSATQYALFSSLFALPRILSGPVAGVLADTLHWRNFFILSVFTGIPGLWMLQRFVPWGVREPVFRDAEPALADPLSRGELALRAVLSGVLSWCFCVLTLGFLGALGDGGGVLSHLGPLLRPRNLSEWSTVLSVGLVALTVALATAATLAARRGIRRGAEA
jgi:PAT family beta-lactamase induction signal transducer AmpG